MTGATVRAPAVLATAMLLATACAGAGEGDRQPAEAKSRAEVEAEARAEVQALADLAGGPVTTWATRTRRCDIGDPGRSWAMDGTARIPLPADEHVATVRAVRTRWTRAGWDFGDRRIAPDESLPGTVTGSLSAGDPGGGLNVSVTSRSSDDHLAVVFGARCYQPVEGEDPAGG